MTTTTAAAGTATQTTCPEDSLAKDDENAFFHLGRSDYVGRTCRRTRRVRTPSTLTNSYHCNTSPPSELHRTESDEDSDDCPCENYVAHREDQAVERNKKSITNRRIVRAIRPVRKREHQEISEIDDEDSPPEENASTCAICLEPEMRKRPLLVLPCCGSNGKEYASSTRFCDACVHKCLKTDDAPSHSAWSGSLIGECPRCKHLLVKDWNLKSTLEKANPVQMIWYAELKHRGEYLYSLIVLAWCYSRYVPEEVFTVNGVSLEILWRLCRWGLLHKYQHCKQQNLYWIEPDAQEAIRSWIQSYITVYVTEGRNEPVDGVDNVEDNGKTLLLFISRRLFCAAVEAGRKCNPVACFRLYNRGVILSLVAYRLLGNFDGLIHRWIGWLVSCLMVFLVYLVIKILVEVFWILQRCTSWTELFLTLLHSLASLPRIR